MALRIPFFRAAAFGAMAATAGLAPQAPADAQQYLNCMQVAVAACRNGGWEGAYASEAECIGAERRACEDIRGGASAGLALPVAMREEHA